MRLQHLENFVPCFGLLSVFFSRTIIKIPFHAKQDLSSTCLSEKDGLDLIAKLIENLYFTRAVFNG